VTIGLRTVTAFLGEVAGASAANLIGVTPDTARTYDSVSRAFDLSMRIDNLSFFHHRIAMAVPADFFGDQKKRRPPPQGRNHTGLRKK
jgi:hypothetical protein